ncbi:MAG TPA: sigma factor, partial [Chloroflexota bacterium]|nr:sigma factor [Chloroflexota bacterium]
MKERDEAQLVATASAGDQAAFTELVRRYRDRVYGYCYHRTGNFEDARDLAQESFVRAYTSLGQLRDTSGFGPWVRRIAANLCNR